MSIIYLYDIAEGKWYQQEATGQVPENRRKFCAGATWAQDQSSYNIYLYGGAGFAENATGFDDVYILTLPSFTWIKWYPTEPGPGSPHNSLSCNVIDNAQMLIIGGTFPGSDMCDAPDVVGTHNLNLGKNNPKQAKWELFDPHLTTYNVPSEIIAVVGGSATGGATVSAPAGEWNNRDLRVYFQQQATYPPRSPTRFLPNTGSAPDPGSKTNKGAIIGGAVGGGLAVLLLLGLAIFFWMRRRGRRASHREPEMAHSQSNVRTDATGPGIPPQSSPSTGLPSYAVEPKPMPPPAPGTMTNPYGSALSTAPGDHPYTSTPSPVAGAPSPYQLSQSPALHPASFSPPNPSLPYQHPAHSPPSQQQPYFPPPPMRQYAAESDALRPDPRSTSTVEMPTVTSPRPWNKSPSD